MKLVRTIATIAALLLLFGFNAVAHADDVQDAARALFKEAAEQYTNKEYDAALPKFIEAQKTLNSPNATLYIARCLRELGRLPEAYDKMGEAVQLATERAQTEERYVATRDTAASERVVLEQRVALLVIVVVDPPDEGLVVSVAGAELNPERYGGRVAVPPGKVNVTATAPGHQAFTVDKMIAAGASYTLNVKLEREVVTPVEPTEPPEEPVSLNEFQIGGIALLGLGVAGWVVFGVMASQAQSEHDRIHDECGQARCTDPSFNEEIDDGRTLTTVANVGFGVGIAGVVAGGALILFGTLSGSDDPGVTVEASPEGAALGYRLRF